jgi:hypothetical protein
MLASPATATLLPLQVHEAVRGNWKPLALSALSLATSTNARAPGAYLSVACSEDVPALGGKRDKAIAAGTLERGFRLRQLKAACLGWPVRDLGPDFHAAVTSDAPALLISGERDPVTPVSGGERVARTLKRARRLVIANAPTETRGMQGDDCVPALLAAFVAAGTTEGLDTSCVTQLQRPDFELPEVKVAKADLEPLTGSYLAGELGYAIKVDLVDDRLRLTITAGPPFPPARLIPLSRTRFRWEGEGLASALIVDFQVAGGKATSVTILQPGKPHVVMKRTE